MLEPSYQVWTGSITVLVQLRQLHTWFSPFLGFACPRVMAGKQSYGERSSTEPPATDSEESPQLTHSVPTSCSTQRLQALRKRAQVLLNYHFILLARRSWGICGGGFGVQGEPGFSYTWGRIWTNFRKTQEYWMQLIFWDVVNASTRNKVFPRTNCLHITFYFQLKLSGTNAFYIS